MILERTYISEIAKFINDPQIIVLHGARQVGKTTILEYFLNKFNKEEKLTAFFDLEDARYREVFEGSIDSVITFLQDGGFIKDQEKTYLFLDEIQYLTNPSPLLKLLHDHHKNLKIFVSGSSSFEIKSKFSDSLVGRTIDFEIFGLSFEEFLTFKGEKINFPISSEFFIEKLQNYWNEFALFGGYPQIVLTKEIEKKEIFLRQILTTYVEKDVRHLANIKDLRKFNTLIEILAENAGDLLNTSEIANTLGLARQTVDQYLFLLENTYIIRRVYPFHKNIRSELSKMPKIYFEDTGLLNLLLNKKRFSQTLTGKIFENSIFRHLRRSYPLERLFFWRTNTGQEIDFILNRDQLQAIEVKLQSRGKKDFRSLKAFQQGYPNSSLAITALNIHNSYKKLEQNIYPWEL